MTTLVSTDGQIPSAADLQPWLQRMLDAAARAGAGAAEVQLGVSRGLSVGVRLGEVESVQFQRDRDLSLTVYFGQRSGSATATELSEESIARTVAAACAIARVGGEDPCVGLADPARMATYFPDLDLFHPWAISTDEAIDLARDCERAALAVDPRLTQSEGAGVDTRQSISGYANSHGFIGFRRSTDHAVSCSPIAVQGESMQVGNWYTTARCADDLQACADVGRIAGERAIARLGARRIATRTAPVLFPPQLARGLFGHFVGAISGSSLYRRASFLLDKAGEQIFPATLTARQLPLLPRGAASSAYDHEGVATAERVMIDKGVLTGYLLGSYSARKLGLETTGNAGGIYNLAIEPTFVGGRDALLREMGSGFLVSELMGQGANTMTGDYSRGASGFWVENGEIQFPVQEVTIAGNLREMFLGMAAIGDDIDTRGGIRSGSVLLDSMTIAGEGE
jgi:PmbA protein